MPYRWTDTRSEEVLTLWPHQSLTGRGLTWFMGSTGALLSLPLFAVLGSPIAWVLMVFFLATIWGVWRAILANRKHMTYHEELTLSSDRLHLAHIPWKGPKLEWEANPHWVSVNLRNDGPVERYLTLRGGGREVELGSFLTPEERESLHADLNRRLRAA